MSIHITQYFQKVLFIRKSNKKINPIYGILYLKRY
nr:MAG TPA: hypothetical protein [Caudoviricetes sp.]